MSALISVFLSLLQVIILFYNLKLFNGINYTKRDYISIIGIIIPSTVLFVFVNTQAVVFLFVCSLVFMYFKKKFMGIVSVLICFFILYMANFTSLWLSTLLVDLVSIDNAFTIFFVIIFTIASIIYTYIAKFFIKRLSFSDLSLNKIYLTLVSLFLLTILGLMYFYLPQQDVTFGDAKFISIMYAVVIVTTAILIVTISFSIIRQIQYKRNMQEIENYYKYTLQIEEINNEMRKFRHDYVNILSTLSDFIREDDMEGLRKYFNEEIMPMQDNMQMKSLKINGIENLKVREIKGLLTTKILQAQEKNIRLSIEVPEPIEKIDMPIINLSRVIGILLDNAIEASEKIEEDPLIRIAFIKNEDASVTFIVMNKCKPDMPRVHTLFQENYSTKGKNRGLGLSNLKEITDATSNVLLDTTIDNNYFIQKVEILNSDS
ncbi:MULTISPECIES: quorum-sensing sensor histidine kinase AgrC [Staphylococcus]|jgi:two-component system sensor histidine kinase AgrC|uniref:Accessory gene regulator C n=1 Tax=Staphylococcus nepalensis TaxID=214473 RepID=A0A380GLK7_9STAP|nr:MULTISPECIES: GHKL domain-containing protein [Staphylococcus]VDG66625.1 ATP-binding protein [Lacrimispora indolis]MBO1222416.1 GHKL domain-containing protein [Staphylococcus nepalensis]MCD8892748.1 GHKL domain-containing protein [Staphylococcus nepalensis]MDR5650447.1 GHKL domain-containing protein [Staphylococcus nepalensis]PNZ97889.1 ATP-binding protein [Staphylococcus nepalensis]